ncbi:MAG: hypothetical protein BAJATHORv1_20564 [Candidatus Thorarchaeota archaeon]|nr:MAG: hypothetical protein BAJATHORv1_20564 [Candidatus Thorarchaeota archaeon]
MNAPGNNRERGNNQGQSGIIYFSCVQLYQGRDITNFSQTSDLFFIRNERINDSMRYSIGMEIASAYGINSPWERSEDESSVNFEDSPLSFITAATISLLLAASCFRDILTR